MNYYNDIEPFAVQWLKNLIAAGILPPGDVDSRPIQEVTPSDLIGYTQCHFFAGIGGWSLALGLAGWPANRPAWTGSCPCQPFSNAGSQKGEDDERHLWPFYRDLIAECGPSEVFGEQVESKVGRKWLAGVQTDLEGLGYAVGRADVCAAGVGAPHIRQRLWWVADSSPGRLGVDWSASGKPGHPDECGEGCRLAHTKNADGRSGECGAQEGTGQERLRGGRSAGGGIIDSRMDHALQQGLEGFSGNVRDGHEPGRLDTNATESTSEAGGNYWSGFIWIPCADGKARRIKPGIAPLAHGIPGRVGQIRAYGNAIVSQVAAEFIRAYMDIK